MYLVAQIVVNNVSRCEQHPKLLVAAHSFLTRDQTLVSCIGSRVLATGPAEKSSISLLM